MTTSKAFKILMPTVVGILTVAGLLMAEELLHEYFITPNPNSDTPPPLDWVFDLFILIPISFIAGVFQIFIVLPIWTKHKTNNKIYNLNLWQVTGLLSLLGGIGFGLVFWSPELGVIDFIEAAAIGLIIFVVYSTLNLLTLSLLDK